MLVRMSFLFLTQRLLFSFITVLSLLKMRKNGHNFTTADDTSFFREGVFRKSQIKAHSFDLFIALPGNVVAPKQREQIVGDHWWVRRGAGRVDIHEPLNHLFCILFMQGATLNTRRQHQFVFSRSDPGRILLLSLLRTSAWLSDAFCVPLDTLTGCL